MNARQDDLNAHPPARVGSRDACPAARTRIRGVGQPAALPGDRLEHPAQPVRDALLGVHRGLSLICRSAAPKVVRVRLVIAQCTVDYVGRLTAHLPSARRLLLVKADGSVSVHADDRAYKPLNWMSPPCWLTEEPDGPLPVWVVENKAGGAAAHHRRGGRARLQPRARRRSRTGQGRRRGAPAGAAGRARRAARRRLHAGAPRVHDRDRAGRPAVPRRAGPLGGRRDQAPRRDRRRRAAHPLPRAAQPRHRCWRPSRGMFAAQQIKPQARTLATDRGIRCVTLDYDADARHGQRRVPAVLSSWTGEHAQALRTRLAGNARYRRCLRTRRIETGPGRLRHTRSADRRGASRRRPTGARVRSRDPPGTAHLVVWPSRSG